jgi:hypothetical protein
LKAIDYDGKPMTDEEVMAVLAIRDAFRAAPDRAKSLFMTDQNVDRNYESDLYV